MRGGARSRSRAASRGTSLHSNSFDVRRWPTKEYDIILGDTNAHSLLWDDNWEKPEADERGRVLENWCATHNMTAINDGRATRRSRNAAGKGTALDQAFVHSSRVDKFTWQVLDDLSSDHKPIIITYQDQFPSINNKPTFKWNLKKADWAKFSAMVEESIPRHYAAKNLNKVEKLLRKAIIKSGSRTMRQSGIGD